MDEKRQKPPVNFGAFKRIAKMILKKYSKRLILVIICIIISSVVSVKGLSFIQVLIDDYIEPLLLDKNPDFEPLKHQLFLLACLYLTGILTSLTYNLLMVTVGQGTLKQIRDTMFTKLQNLPIKYFDTNTHGDIMSRFTNDTDTLEEMITRAFPQFIKSLASVIAIVVAMVKLSAPLTIIVLILMTSIFATTKAIVSRSSKFFMNQQQILGKVNGYIEEMLTGQKVIKVFNHEEKTKAEFDALNEELFENQYKAHRAANILMPAINNVGNLTYVLIAIIGGYFAVNGILPNLTVGVIASFLALTRSFMQPVKQVSSQINSIIMALAGATRIFSLIDQEEEVDDGYVTLVKVKEGNGNFVETDGDEGIWAWKHPHHTGETEYVLLKGDILIDNVDFSYDGEKNVLEDIYIFAKPGQKIALVGSTGAGKTTIANLLNRFYDVSDGKIRYDGININKIKKKDLRRALGMVLQDTNLFTGTIKDNIRYGKLDATDDEIIEAAKLANADSFIRRLPEGYDTVIKENGAALSQGQRQLIAIARCAINNPPSMILDEATSSIDTRTEKIVQDGMDKLMNGRTVFVIAHRLSTVRNSKAIMVMEHGKIIERGNHEELLELKGEYYQLYTGQVELE
ncbi:MAG: ABC transporter ATP-binding protein [Clostridia bacterium]|nr:ABC transporter ATP-binding protein [Clostridia bacterium]